MFPVGKSEAEQKFWQTPEVIEELLKFLDLESTLRLARTHKMTQSILQGNWAWKNLIKRTHPLNRVDKVDHLVEILKLMEDTRDNVLDLLDAICKSNPFWEILRKEDGEAAWTRLCQIMDLSEKEWLEKAKRDEEDTEDKEDA